ncbi:MAG: type III-B CRISPR module RAMP protein Cmr6 [Verrucomicrobia bacterium]|nr:type III-B CRISPR module RAMP protein Cmr6 [Verrucomicrobiota bacterium]
MKAIATIPMVGDLAELIGPAAERVENRSLLLDKFAFHKKWPEVVDNRGGEVKWDEASRWSFMRIADGASLLLQKEALDKRRKAEGSNVEPQNRERYSSEARIAETLTQVKWDSTELNKLRTRHTRRFLDLLRRAYGGRAAITIGQLEGRLAINLADSLIQNAGICLDRLFGLPFIPGTAVKGVTRHAALSDLRAGTEDEKARLLPIFCAVFGTAETDFADGDLRDYRRFMAGKGSDQKGAVSFLPAHPLNEARIIVDLTNVHYPDYYRTGMTEDLSREKPRPNPFPVVETGTQFAFCLVLNGMSSEKKLLEQATRWLELALTENGIGAKTASGYGWFSIQPDALSVIEAENRQEAEIARVKAEEARNLAEMERQEAALKATLSPVQLAADELLAMNVEAFAAFAKTLGEKEEPQQRALIQLLRTQQDKRERWKTWKKKKPDIATAVSYVCTQLNLPPLP